MLHRLLQLGEPGSARRQQQRALALRAIARPRAGIRTRK